MNQPLKPGKRIVSKGEYVANTGKKAALSSYGAGVFLVGIACTVITWDRVVPKVWPTHSSGMFTCIIGLGMLGICSLTLFYYGSKAVQDAIEMDAGVPITRANTADLPVADSLVRASEEPPQDQAAILLRAATYGHSSLPEEMVRASIGTHAKNEQG